jgi:hypothetical protein
MTALIDAAPHAVNIGDSQHDSIHTGRKSPQGESDPAGGVPSYGIR